MWFWLFVIILGVGIGITILGWWMYENTVYDTEWLENTGIVISVIAAIVVGVMGIFIIDGYVNVDAKIARKEQIYNSLVYQLENDLYDNDNDLGKKELYDQIEDWNKDLAYYQNAQDNLWCGIFYPNIYDQFEFIEYK